MTLKIEILALIMLLALTACQGEVAYQTEDRSLGLDGAQSVEADIVMRAGDLTIHSGAAQDLLQAAFSYNSENEPPELAYTVADGRGDLAIRGSGGPVGFSIAGKDNIWDLGFNKAVPLDLSLSVSDADAMLDLSDLSLTRLETENNTGSVTADLSAGQPALTAIDAESNAGQVTFDLSGRYEALSTINAELNAAQMELDLGGDWLRDLDINIIGGTGNRLTLKLPQDTGVAVHVASENNEVTATGLEINNNTYTNEAHGTAPVNLNINIDFNRGEIALELEQ